MLDTASPIMASPLDEDDDTEWPTMSPTSESQTIPPATGSLAAAILPPDDDDDDASSLSTTWPSSPNPTTFLVKATDDVIDLYQGTRQVFIGVLDNDTGSNLFVHAITSQPTNGQCSVSLSRSEIVFILNESTFMGSEQCSYETCNDKGSCDTAIVRVNIGLAPSAYPSSSLSPTISTSLLPTLGPQCEGSNPQVCGCASVRQADYRGNIGTTASGKECIRWDETQDRPQNYPGADLRDNNYCRNPRWSRVQNRLVSLRAPIFPNQIHRAYCYKEDGLREDCDIPYCFPLAPKCSSLLDQESQAACAYHQCAAGSEYELDDHIAPVRAKVKPDCHCEFEVWDCQFGSKECSPDWLPIVPPENQALMQDYECCVNKLNDSNSIATEASCDCLIKPECEAGDPAKCVDFADYCCDENDQQCKCESKTKACRLALESDVEEVSAMALSYCDSGSDACCGENDYGVGLCTCDYWEQLCTDFPNAELTAYYDEFNYNMSTTACSEASTFCCSSDPSNDNCKCDLLTYAVQTLGYEDSKDEADSSCIRTKTPKEPPYQCDGINLQVCGLESIYNETGGLYWYNNTGWITKQDHCSWFGITCDEEDYVIEINLPSNNIAGEFPSNSLSNLYNLQRLLLGNNSLHGTMAGTSLKLEDIGGSVTDTSLFFNLRDLTHVDLSQNNLSGEVDVLFAPALQYVNFSHNNFTSINSFKKFKRSHQTLTICDVSNNFINTSASDLMKSSPPNIEQLIVSNNVIHGPLPTTLEELANLRIFNMSMNSLSGEISDFSNSYPNLQVLDLSDQGSSSAGLVGNIPESLANLPFLSTLNLGGNQLSSIIPPVLGNMGQLRVLNLSSNKLSQPIPKELGKLGEFAHIICACCRSMTLILHLPAFTAMCPSRS